MIDISQEIELLERCASECELIAGLATDQQARYENEKLGSEYREIVEELKSISGWEQQASETADSTALGCSPERPELTRYSGRRAHIGMHHRPKVLR
jgi:hypothetical protein